MPARSTVTAGRTPRAQTRRVASRLALGGLIVAIVSLGMAPLAGALSSSSHAATPGAPQQSSTTTTPTTTPPSSSSSTSTTVPKTPTSTPTPTPAIPAGVGSAKSYTLGIQGSIGSEDGVPTLLLQKKDFCKCDNRDTEEVRPLPGIVTSGTTSGKFGYNTPFPSLGAAELTFWYKLDGTPFEVKGSALVTVVGSASKSCEILKGPSTVSDDSPYICTVVFTSDKHGDPQPAWRVEKKPVTPVLDPTLQAQLLTENCGAGQPECTYKAKSQTVLQAPKTQWQIYGSPHSNCNSKEGEEHVVETDHSIDYENSISVKVGAKFDIKVVKAEVEVEYQHAVTEGYTFKEKHTQKVEYGRVGAFYLQPGYVEINGDFTIVKPSVVYAINDVTFDLPLGKEVRPNNDGPVVDPMIVRSVDLGAANCASRGTSATG